MEQLIIAPPPHGSFGALLRACRHRAYLSQEQLAARAEVSERTVRNLEAGRVCSPRTDTVRLLADALQLDEPERGNWFAAARGVNHQWAGPAAPGADGPAQLPGDVPAQRPRSACGFGRGNCHRRERSPATEFQAVIVALCQRGNGPIAQVARDVNPDEVPVRTRASRAYPDAGSRSDGRLTCAGRRELAELRRETAGSAKKPRFLQRAMVIFAAATW